MPSLSPPARGRRGFSLVEVLVVMGLIALLVGILVPALGAARRHAQTVECATRLRQLVVGMEIYADQNDGFYPPRNGGDPAMASLSAPGDDTASHRRQDDAAAGTLPPLQRARDQVWPVVITSNLRQVAINVATYQADEVGFLPEFLCPSDPDPTPAMSATERFIPWYASFVFNGFNDFRYASPSHWPVNDTTAMRRDEVKRPSVVGLFGEKKSGRQFAKLHVDIYGTGPYDPLTVLDEFRHQGGFSNVAFGDASTRTFAPPGTLSPVNLWAVRDSNRYAPRPRD